MYKGLETLCIIPARGGSKGLPGKNIKPFNNKPLLSITIKQVKKSKFVDAVYVCTDDQNIKNIALEYGANVIDQPPDTATDQSSSIDALLYCIAYLKDKGLFWDNIMQLECTSPLRKPNDIDAALKTYIDSGADSLICLGKTTSDTDHPYLIKKVDDNRIKPYIKDCPKIYQRQQIDEAYQVFGGIYITKVWRLKELKSFYQEIMAPYFVERWQMFEIDDEVDFICSESIYKRFLGCMI